MGSAIGAGLVIFMISIELIPFLHAVAFNQGQAVQLASVFRRIFIARNEAFSDERWHCDLCRECLLSWGGRPRSTGNCPFQDGLACRSYKACYPLPKSSPCTTTYDYEHLRHMMWGSLGEIPDMDWECLMADDVNYPAVANRDELTKIHWFDNVTF